MSEKEVELILKAVLGELLRKHSLPWTMDWDWCDRVIAKDGTIIAKCSNPELARAIIQYAEQYQAELDKSGEEIDRKLASGEI